MKRRDAWAISHRSGMKFPLSEMIREPTTNLLIHKSESDGYFFEEEQYLRKQLKFTDPKPLKNIRPDVSWILDITLTNEDDLSVTNEQEVAMELL